MDRKKVSLIKIGGNVLVKFPLFLSFIKKLWEESYNFVLLHGGGNEINYWMEKLGLEPKFVKGRRVTDKDTLKIVEMVLSGDIQGRIIAEMIREKIKVIGINGKSIFKCKKLIIDDMDLGYVGDVVNVETLPVEKLLDYNYIVVTSSIGVDEEGNSYNVNADSAALSLGIHLQVSRLIFCTDVPGIILKKGEEEIVLNKVSVNEAKELIKTGKITGGMIPKVEAAITAIERGIDIVQIWGGDNFEKAWNMNEGTVFYK